MRKKDHKIKIEPKQSIFACFQEIFFSREVLFMLAWRDIQVRYKQTALGFAWSLLRPALTMGVFVVVFGRVAHLPSNGIPYPLLVLAALLPWMFFSHTLTIGTSSLVDNAGMLRRTYFPRILMPMASVGIHLSDCVISLFLFVGMACFYKFSMDVRVLILPFFMIHMIILTLGVTFFLSIMAARWRDVTYVAPFLIQIGFFVSPIGYITSIIPDNLKLFFYLNPIVGLVEAFRWALLAGKAQVHWDAYIISLGISIMMFIAGSIFFIRSEPKVIDIL